MPKKKPQLLTLQEGDLLRAYFLLEAAAGVPNIPVHLERAIEVASKIAADGLMRAGIDVEDFTDTGS